MGNERETVEALRQEMTSAMSNVRLQPETLEALRQGLTSPPASLLSPLRYATSMFGFPQYSAHAQLGVHQVEMAKLALQITEMQIALNESNLNAQQKEKKVQEINAQYRELEAKQSLSHLLQRVGPDAQEKLLRSQDFKKRFTPDSPSNAYVLSIDIRRSTELMLKARDPKRFARFIIELADKLRATILDSYGVFDKFTGDGILAFFPDFYSGQDAGWYAIQAASTCHKIFAAHYEANKNCFISVLKDIGLGIGLDYGEVQVVQIGSDFTVVGTPVVYACRMGGAEAKCTYANQPAYEQLFERYSAICDFDDTEIDIKHEGNTQAYRIRLNGKLYTAQQPDWLAEGDESEAAKMPTEA